MEIIKRKKKDILVKQMVVSDLDKSKCSHKFLKLSIPEDFIVYVKCHENGDIDYRGNKGEYRIIVPD